MDSTNSYGVRITILTKIFAEDMDDAHRKACALLPDGLLKLDPEIVVFSSQHTSMWGTAGVDIAVG